MLRIAVMVSGGGTNLQAIIDGVKDKTITNTQIAAVISNMLMLMLLQELKRTEYQLIVYHLRIMLQEMNLIKHFLKRLIRLM